MTVESPSSFSRFTPEETGNGNEKRKVSGESDASKSGVKRENDEGDSTVIASLLALFFRPAHEILKLGPESLHRSKFIPHLI
jgi:hypothetical protein